MRRKLSIALSALLMVFADGCDNKKASNQPNNSNSSNSADSSSSSGQATPTDCEFCNSKAATISYPKEEEYTPITLDTQTWDKRLYREVAPGVEVYRVRYDLTTILDYEGNHITAYVTEVDLKKADIVAEGSGLAKILNHAENWKANNSGREVYVATNADFFNQGSGTTVNAYVKDGAIIKTGHNVDYNDVPESSPMLFGVASGLNQAQIGAMTNSTAKNVNVEAKLEYGLEVYNLDCSSDVFSTLVDGNLSNIATNWIYKKALTVSTDHVVVELRKESLDKNILKGYVSNIIDISAPQVFTPASDASVTYLAVPKGEKNRYAVDTPIVVGFVKSQDSKWNYYDTILGARHSLVEQGQLAATVSKESSNGAKNRVPRTAIGIKNDGKVMIVSVEDLEYNSKKTGVTVNTGVNLTELADFMRYYGAYNAANFDGGGSTQLLVNQDGDLVCKVRSSDYGTSYDNKNSRVVANAILVVSKA